MSIDKTITSSQNLKKSTSVILCFFFGHAVFHFMGQSFAVLLPSIQATFLVTPIQIGALITTREIVSGFIALPGGVMSDYYSRYRAHILTTCIVVFAAGWLIIAITPIYSALYLGMLLIAAASAIWHIPSLVELGSRFPEKRGTVFAIHGAGGSVGDVIGPVATGILLAYFSWREILSVYLILPLLLAIWTFLLLTRLYRGKKEQQEPNPDSDGVSPSKQLQISWQLLKTTDIWKVNIVAGLRSMCFTVLITFLPIYMHDSGFSSQSIGFHFGLLWSIGLLVSPLMGYLSDRFGRKIVLVPALLYSSTLVIALAFWGKGGMFTLLIILLGFSIRSDYSLINATIVDMVKGRAENTMLGLLTFFRSLMGATAPLIAGALYQYQGMQSTLVFVGVLFFMAAIVFALVKIEPEDVLPASTCF